MRILLGVGATEVEATTMPQQLWIASADTDDGSPMYDAMGPDPLTAVCRLAKLLANKLEHAAEHGAEPDA